MLKISVCADCFYVGCEFDERVQRIAAAGYSGIEFWHPEGAFNGRAIDVSQPRDPEILRQIAQRTGVEYAGFAFCAWDGTIGGNATDASDRAGWLEHTRQMINFAREINCRKGIILSGLARDNLSEEEMDRNILETFSKGAAMAEQSGITLLIEPLNSYIDHPGYYYDTPEKSVELIRTIGSPNLKLLYDIYHMQIMEGNIIAFIEKNIDIIGHFHAAGVPGRSEIFNGELNYPLITRRIESLGYTEYFGLEYFPSMDDDESLRRTLEYVGG